MMRKRVAEWSTFLLGATVLLSGIPWCSPERGLNHSDCPDHVRKVLNEDGSIDVRELNHRINELAMQYVLDRQTRQIG